MKNDHYVLRRGNKLEYCEAGLITPENALLLSHPIRLQILRLLAKREMYPAEIASTIGVHEQKVYYHIRQLMNAGMLTIHERSEIRGTVAKRYKATSLNFCLSLGGEWQNARKLLSTKKEKLSYLSPFIEGTEFNSTFVVGSPDPHGPHKARARDSHYAVELALFLGNYCSTKSHFSTMLDVDMNMKTDPGNLILVGGPVTNLLVDSVNKALPVRFSKKKPWELVSSTTGKKYTEETTGIVARIPNPGSDSLLLVLAGIRAAGTKSAVLAVTTNKAFKDFKGEESYCRVVNGFDLDGDGRVDNVEILE